MIVKGRLLYAALLEFHHHRFDFILSEYKVTHDHRGGSIFAESYPRTQGESCFDIHAIERDMQILTRQTELDYVSGLHLSGTSHRVLYRFPIRSGLRKRVTYAQRTQDGTGQHQDQGSFRRSFAS